jgi:O-antigen/teichoic acid export membrane protein
MSGAGWSTVAMLITTAAQMTQIIILGRILSPEAFGTVALLMIIISFSEFFSQMGLSEAVIQESHPTRTELSTLYCLNILLGIGVFSILFGFNLIAEHLNFISNITPYLPYIAVTFFILPWGQLHKALLQKNLIFKPIAIGESFASVIGTIAAVICAYNGLEIWSLIIGYLIKCIISTIILMVSGRSLLKFTTKIQFTSIQRYLHFGLNLMAGNIFNFINSRIDQILVGSILGTQALGYYSMAFNLVLQPISKINPILTSIAFPVLTRFKSQPERLKSGYLNMLNLVATINAPLLFGVSAVAPLLIPLLIGDQWIPAIPIIQVLAIYAFIRSLGNAGGSLILACGRAELSLQWNMMLTLFIPITIFVSAHFFGLIGVATGLVLLQVILFFVWYFRIVKLLIGPCIIPYINSILIATATSIAMFLTIKLIPSNILVSELSNLILLISCGVVFYTVTNIILRKNEILNLIKSRSK